MKISLFITLFSCISVSSFSQQLQTQNKPDELFNDGIALLSHNQYATASKSFADFLEAAPATDPRRRDAEYYTALCAVNLYHADGEKRIDKFIESNPTHPRAATAYYDLGKLFYQQKNYTKASASFSKVDFPSLGDTDQAIGHFFWGYSLFNLRKLPEALDQFNFMKSQGGQYGPAASYYAGYIEFTNGDHASALIDLKRAELNDSYSRIVPYMIAQVLYKQKKYDELLTYTKSVENREGVAQPEEIALLTSEVYFSKGDYANALKGYEVYMEEKKNADRGVAYRAGYAAMKINEDQKAMDFLKTAANGSDSVSAYSSYYLGSIYLKTNQKPQAITAFDASRKFKGDPSLAEESSFQYAKLSYDVGRADQSIQEFEKFQVNFPNSTRATEVKEILSQAYVNANNYNKAIEYIESLPRRGPSVDKAYQKATYLKGTELFNMDRYSEATTFFEKSLQYPLDLAMAGEARYWCAEAYSILGNNDRAVDQYSAIVSTSSGASADVVTKARYGLGYAYFNNKQYERALFNFREFVNKASRNNSYLPDAQLRLADSYLVTKAYPEALSMYRKVTETSSPDKDYAHLQAGIILGIDRKYAEAAAELNRVVTQFPGSSYKEQALFNLAQLDFEQGKYQGAAAGYTRVIEGSKSSPYIPHSYQRRAAAYYNLKDYNKTASDYIYLVENYPTHSVTGDVLLPLQEALNLAGRSGEFDKYLNVVKSVNPNASGMESVQFESAKNAFYAQDYTQTITRINNFLSSYPESPRIVEAKYYLAESYYRQKNFDQALKGYLEIENDNTFSQINKVVARIGELQFKSRHYELAVPAFGRLARMATNKKDQSNAWTGLMESHYLLAQYDSADKYAHLVIEQGNINAGAVNKASLYLGKTAMARGDYEAAKDEFLNTLNSAQDEYGAEAKYLMGEIFFLQKEYKQCYETLVGLNRDFAAYKIWVGRSFLLLADKSLAEGDVYQARGTLKSLVDDFPEPEIRDRAAEKLRQLDAAEKAKSTPTDTTENKP